MTIRIGKGRRKKTVVILFRGISKSALVRLTGMWMEAHKNAVSPIICQEDVCTGAVMLSIVAKIALAKCGIVGGLSLSTTRIIVAIILTTQCITGGPLARSITGSPLVSLPANGLLAAASW